MSWGQVLLEIASSLSPKFCFQANKHKFSMRGQCMQIADSRTALTSDEYTAKISCTHYLNDAIRFDESTVIVYNYEYI